MAKILLAIEAGRAIGRGQLIGISKYARIHGPWRFLTKHDCYFGGSDFPPLEKGVIDGAIIREPAKEDMNMVRNLGVPLVLCAHWTVHPPFPHVITDCVAIGEIGADHFLNAGFRHFAFCGTGELFWSERRCQGFVNAVTEAGYRAHVYKVPARRQDRLWTHEQRILADWLTSLPKPIGLMACTDDRAFELVEVSMAAGVKVPEEVAILGVDDDDLVCEMSPVPISSVALNLEQAGYYAAELLHKLIRGQKPKQQEILIRPTHIHKRRSTNILAIEDPTVAKAMQFIHSQAKKFLQVSDVARHVAISQRRLFDLFQAALGRSVFEEITRVRIAEISWMLERTQISTKEISEIMEMPDERHLSRFFRRHKNATPMGWRKQQTQIALGHRPDA